jgi:hypothetical protein
MFLALGHGANSPDQIIRMPLSFRSTLRTTHPSFSAISVFV